MSNPFKVFRSDLTGRIYASEEYKELGPGQFEVTGKKHDVTEDVAQIIEAKTRAVVSEMSDWLCEDQENIGCEVNRRIRKWRKDLTHG